MTEPWFKGGGDPATKLIECRACIDPECLNGKEHPDEDFTMALDGTYDGRTIVCDPCYVMLMPFTPSGAALNEEIPQAISDVRTNLAFLKRCSDEELEAAIEQAVEAASEAAPDTPRQRSAKAAAHLAEAERDRRASK